MTTPDSRLEIVRVPCLRDNYGWVLHDPETGATAVVDTPEAAPLQAAIADRGWTLTHILNTHHHYDHTGHNEALKAATGCTIVGPAADRDRIPGIDIAVDEGEELIFGSRRATVFFTPGHTRGHICYHFADDHALFCGDVIFAMGCGRLFEGTPAQMWDSFRRLRALPAETRVYCAHEYTQSNGRFARTVEPDNLALRARCAEVAAMRERGEATVPSTLAQERATNPFMRVDLPELQRAVGMLGSAPAEIFGEIRRRKDSF